MELGEEWWRLFQRVAEGKAKSMPGMLGKQWAVYWGRGSDLLWEKEPNSLPLQCTTQQALLRSRRCVFLGEGNAGPLPR